MTDSSSTVRRNASWLRWQQTTTAILCGTTLVTIPMIGNAQETGESSVGNEAIALLPLSSMLRLTLMMMPTR